MRPSLRSLDMFKRLPKDLTEGSYTGAIISIGCLLLIVTLIMFEISDYFDESVSSVLILKQSGDKDKLYINVDITFPACPWDVISLDVQDELGTHVVDVSGNLKKIRLNPQKGTTDIAIDALGQSNIKNELERAKNAFDNNEGCALKGYFMVNKVPGNFHIGSHAFNELLMMLQKPINLTHTINHLSFGYKKYVETIEFKFKGKFGELSPLNGWNHLSDSYGKTANYQLNIVPAIYEDRLGLEYPVNQFTYAYGAEITGIEVVYFKYDIIGTTVKYYYTGDYFFQFLIGICSIIGGIFTVGGFFTIMLNKSISVIYKKDIGKYH